MKNLIKFNSIRGIFLLLVASAVMIYVGESSLNNYLNPSTATMPGTHLKLAENALLKGDYRTGYKEIHRAIKAMNTIEHYSDSIAVFYIEESISELELLKLEIAKDSINTDDFRHAFYRAFNAMAYANLRLSELRLEQGRQISALEYFKISFSYLKKSLNYSNDAHQDEEQKVLDDLRMILLSLKSDEEFRGFDYEQINQELEHLINN